MADVDWIAQFKQYLERRAPGRRTATVYMSDLRQFSASYRKPWTDVTMQDIDAFVDQQRQAGLSPATIKRRVAALKVFFDFLAEETGQLAWPNPVRFKRHAGKQPQRLPRDLKDAEVEQVWAVISAPRDRAWFALMLRAGLRAGEVVGLRLDDLLAAPHDGQPAQLRVQGKGQKERLVLLTADAYAVLQAWLKERPDSEQSYVFLNERKERLSVNGLEWLLHRYGEQAGLDLTPHQLRHTFARQLTEAGLPLTSLSKLMGHAQISTTQIYTAGADPALAQAYQAAMKHLSEGAAAAPPVPALAPPGSDSPPLVAPPPPPVWDEWAPSLPAWLRECSVAFVRSRLADWKPSHQRLRAVHLLGQLRRFYEWRLVQRPLASLAEITLADLRAYQTAGAAAGRAPQTDDKTLRSVLGLLRQAADQGQPVDASVFRLEPRPQPDSLPRHLSESEAQCLERFVSARLASPDTAVRLENACYFVLAHTGLRASECVDLLFQDLDLPGGRLIIRQGKGLRDRVVYLSDPARQALQHYLAGQARLPAAPLFTYANGRPISYGWLWQHITQLGEAAAVTGLTPHRLRHTLATRLLNSGMELSRIQKLLGHQHIDTTLIYARVSDVTLEADYRRCMAQIERQQMPLSDVPLVADQWPTGQPASPETAAPAQYNRLDNSV